MLLANPICPPIISLSHTLQTPSAKAQFYESEKIARLVTLSEIHRPLLLDKPTKLMKTNNIRICL